MRVRIVQLLCPERHCVVALAYLSDDGKEDSNVAVGMMKLFDQSGFDPWCGICKSRNLHTEDGLTVFSSMEEARPHLKELERQQAIAREFFRASRG